MSVKRPSLERQWRGEYKTQNSKPTPFSQLGIQARGQAWGKQTRPLGVAKSDCRFFYLTDQKLRLWPDPDPKQTAISQLLNSRHWVVESC